MPKIVDRLERREELLEAVWRVVGDVGLEATTIRLIADETGWSPGVLAHYFDDKEDLLLSALRLAHERIVARWESKLEGLSGITALRELLMDNLPLDEERSRETKLLASYWSRAIRDPEIRSAKWRHGPQLVLRLTDLVRDAQAIFEITSDDDPQDIAARLLSIIDGLSLHALLDPKTMSAKRQIALIDQELQLLAARPIALLSATATRNGRRP